MGAHASHTMHDNSMASFATLDLTDRQRAVFDVYRGSTVALTDREVATALRFQDMNAVRPIITHLRDEGLLTEAGKIKCPVTGKTVRLVTVLL